MQQLESISDKENKMMDAVILAGGKGLPVGLQEKFPDTSNKAHIRINDRMLVDYVVQAAMDCTQVDKVFVVGDTAYLNAHIENKQVVVLQDTGDIYANFMLAGTKSIKDTVLVLTADIPLITGEILDDFINNCYGREDVYYPIISKNVVLNYDKLANRTYANLVEGSFTGGNIFLVNTNSVKDASENIRGIFAKRKKVLELLKILGISFVIRYGMGRLKLQEVETHVGKILGCKVRAVTTNHVEIGIDVDKLEDFDLVMRNLKI